VDEVLTAEITTAKFPCIRCGEYVYIYRGKKRIRFKIDEVTEPTEDQLLGVEGTQNIGSPWNHTFKRMAKMLDDKHYRANAEVDEWHKWAENRQSSLGTRRRCASDGAGKNNQAGPRRSEDWESAVRRMNTYLNYRLKRTERGVWDCWAESVARNQQRRMNKYVEKSESI